MVAERIRANNKNPDDVMHPLLFVQTPVIYVRKLVYKQCVAAFNDTTIV